MEQTKKTRLLISLWLTPLSILLSSQEKGEGGDLFKVQVYKHVYFTSRNGNLFVIEQSFLQTMLSFVQKINERAKTIVFLLHEQINSERFLKNLKERFFNERFY